MGWPLVGREAEFARVSGRLPAGGGVLIVGEPGAGKTRLARAGLDAAYAHGARAEWVSGAAGASGVPLAAIAHLVPDVETDEGEPTRLLRTTARSLVAPSYGALVIALDDAHSVDPASAAVLHHAVVSGNASMLATARRGETLPEPIAVLVREGRLERLDIPPLSDNDIEALLLGALDGQVEGRTVEQLCEASQGNPMLVRELVNAGLETGALGRRDGLWTWQGPFAAPRLRDLVEARLGRLSSDERAAVEVIALAMPVPLDVAERVTGRDVLDRLDRLELLDTRTQAGHLVVQLAHPLYSEVLRATTSALRRRAIHLDVATAFVELGHLSQADVLRVVTWRLDAQAMNEPSHVHAAGRRALGASDFDLAERIARSGIAAWNDDASRVVLAMALAGQGRIDEAHQTLADADTTDGSAPSAELVSRALDMFFYGSRTTNAAAAVQHVQEVIGVTDDWPEGSEPLVEAARAGVLLLSGAVLDGLAIGARVIEHPDAPAVAQLRAALVAGPAAAIACRTTEALRITAHGLRLLEGGTAASSAATDALVELDAGPLLRANYSLAHRLAGHLGLAGEFAEAGYRAAIADRSPPAQGLFALATGMVMLTEGRVEHAAHRLREAVALLRRPPALYLVWALGYLGQAAGMLGDVTTAAAALAEGEEQRSETFQVFDCDLRQAEAWILAARGEISAARTVALDAAGVAAAAGQVGFAAAAAHDAARLGAATEAARLLDELEQGAEGDFVSAFARHADALAARDPARLLACADRFETLGTRLYAAEAAAAASRLLDEQHSVARARAAAARATTLARGSGDVVTPAMRDLGRTPPLSEREMEVANLAAAGLSNRAIAARLHLSVRTVDNHLHHAYEKLGIAGRDQLATAIGR